MGLIVKCECNGRNYCEETRERGNTLGVELIEIKKVDKFLDKFNLLVR